MVRCPNKRRLFIKPSSGLAIRTVPTRLFLSFRQFLLIPGSTGTARVRNVSSWLISLMWRWECCSMYIDSTSGNWMPSSEDGIVAGGRHGRVSVRSLDEVAMAESACGHPTRSPRPSQRAVTRRGRHGRVSVRSLDEVATAESAYSHSTRSTRPCQRAVTRRGRHGRISVRSLDGVATAVSACGHSTRSPRPSQRTVTDVRKKWTDLKRAAFKASAEAKDWGGPKVELPWFTETVLDMLGDDTTLVNGIEGQHNSVCSRDIKVMAPVERS